MTLASKVHLAVRIWLAFVSVKVGLGLHPLPELLEGLNRRRLRHLTQPISPMQLGRMVSRRLRVGRHSPRCLTTALVLYRLLRERGDQPSLVIGLPHEPRAKAAHAWVELDGLDVGPPPGGRGHHAMVRYG